MTLPKFTKENGNFVLDFDVIKNNNKASQNNFCHLEAASESEADFWKRVAEDSDITIEEYFNSRD